MDYRHEISYPNMPRFELTLPRMKLRFAILRERKKLYYALYIHPYSCHAHHLHSFACLYVTLQEFQGGLSKRMSWRTEEDTHTGEARDREFVREGHVIIGKVGCG